MGTLMPLILEPVTVTIARHPSDCPAALTVIVTGPAILVEAQDSEAVQEPELISGKLAPGPGPVDSFRSPERNLGWLSRRHCGYRRGPGPDD